MNSEPLPDLEIRRCRISIYIPIQVALEGITAQRAQIPDRVIELPDKVTTHYSIELRTLVVIMTLTLTGARPQEICNLRQADVIATDRLVQFDIRSLKRGRNRTIKVFSTSLKFVVEAYRRSRPTTARAPFIFTVQDVDPYPRLIHRIVKLVYPDFSPKAFRHGYATWLLAEGVDPLAIGDQLGHRHLTSTQHYLRSLLAAKIDEAYGKLDLMMNQRRLL